MRRACGRAHLSVTNCLPLPPTHNLSSPGQKINLGRANALKLASAAASAVLRNVSGACLGPVSGGDAINAIPTQARAVLAVSAAQRLDKHVTGEQEGHAGGSPVGTLPHNPRAPRLFDIITLLLNPTPHHPLQVPRDAVPTVQAIATQLQADALLGYGAGEPDLFIKAAPMEAPAGSAAPGAAWGAGQWCLSDKGAVNLLGLLLSLPSGVLQPSLTIPGKSAWRLPSACMSVHGCMSPCLRLRHSSWPYGSPSLHMPGRCRSPS